MKQPFTWLRWTPNTDEVFGQDKAGWQTSDVVLWGEMKVNSASKDTNFDSLQATERGNITLQQLPPLDSRDRLVCKQFGETWVIDGVRRNWPMNQTIVDVHKFEAQQ